MKKNLMLFLIKPYTGKDGSQKYKYAFLDSKGDIFEGYSSELKYETELCEDEEYNAARAREWSLSRDTFNGNLITRVVV